MNNPQPFIAFGMSHTLAMLLVLVSILFLPWLVRQHFRQQGRFLGMLLALMLLLNELVSIIVAVQVYDIPLKASLPLQLCGVAALLTAWMLWQRSYRAYEVAWFWVVAGASPALLTPDLAVGFPHLTFIHFFFVHGLMLLGAFYATIVYGFRPQLHSVGKAVLASLILMLCLTPVNLWLGTNYMYLRAKPSAATLMDYLGPWPWYIGSLIILGTVVYLACYLPFLLLDPHKGHGDD